MAAPHRPAPVLVIAILNFIFGGFSLLGLFCGGISLVVVIGLMQNAPPPPGGGPNPMQELGALFQSIPGYVPFMVVTTVLGILCSVLLLVAGFGLLNMRGWARMLCIFYAIYAILNSLGVLAYQLTVVQPAMEKWNNEFQARMRRPGMPPPPAQSNTPNIVGAVAGSILGMAYAILILVLLNLPDVRRAFARAAAGLPAEGYDDYDDRRPRRRDDYDDDRRPRRRDDHDDRIREDYDDPQGSDQVQDRPRR